MRKWIPAGLIVIAVIVSIVVYPSLPERIPTDWSVSGEISGWSSRLWGAWMLPLVMATIWVIFRAVPHIDPRRANYEKFSGMYDALIISVLAFMLGIHVLLLASARGNSLPLDRIIIAGVGAFFIVMGVLLPRVHPNWFVGIRTPWTLTSDLSWERTHKIGGQLFMAVGALTLLTAAILPKYSIWVLMVSGFTMVVFLFAYSYNVWKGDPARHSL